MSSKIERKTVQLDVRVKDWLEDVAGELSYFTNFPGKERKPSWLEVLRGMVDGDLEIRDRGVRSENGDKALIRKLAGDLPVYDRECQAAFFGGADERRELSALVLENLEVYESLSVDEKVRVRRWGRQDSEVEVV